MKNRKKKIIFSIIIILIAMFGIIGVNSLNKHLESKVNTKDEVVLSDDKSNSSDDNIKQKEESNEDKGKKQDSELNNKKEEKQQENKDKSVKETPKDNIKESFNKEKEQNSSLQSEKSKNNSYINKSQTTNNSDKQEISKTKENVKRSNVENEVKKQSVELSIIDGISNKTLFSSQVPINQNENLNTIMNRIFSSKGIRHINRGGYISMMYGLAEFSKGPSSGWCYYVNGNKASVGISGYTPKNGDKVVWKYLKDGVNN